MISSPHTHRAPYTTALMDEEPNFAYIDFLRERLAEGIGGYEARLGYQSRLVPKAGNLMCETALRLLTRLAER